MKKALPDRHQKFFHKLGKLFTRYGVSLSPGYLSKLEIEAYRNTGKKTYRKVRVSRFGGVTVGSTPVVKGKRQ